MPDPGLRQHNLHIFTKADLPQAAADFLSFIGQKKIILFEGEMAAGKTTFIKAICAQKGVREPVSSPSFSLVNEYETANGELIYHFDFYRINEEAEALDMGALEYFSSGNLCLIEWPSKVVNLLPDEGVEVRIETGDTEEARIISMRVYDGGNDGEEQRV
ncbi:tRNA (adenosine(37)-N6)-threonylcarbamoyltransferase complex ATPase subunit type 1 TsaE [Rufibacter glacialis]|uniref:tRNA threonylcarbamoyladenosine biosynthesis protein TsaE n=1 Tax=Rufibacter glacialis TaxID=1259555 RepID=A0A5M8QLH3_9BACT|nr:tRNA (adenosine(37)-N6)-threonylcarbamoyltransferase complex ATPase subunit type 1 TsaE [Rufibacter glacialis]KAA6435616.1 tRNA (adenosine(37)-N6)-threonylcarbamoyltransferase complex ATPase subunit type 1 TsaE [Rufibacter glacialis]GGK65013.1 tRNA (adenosine(37)-N6)-threonylcarbamoyltransferase complex ATPase subunit type 1 TsaE [Rufibacter glacialis]